MTDLLTEPESEVPEEERHRRRMRTVLIVVAILVVVVAVSLDWVYSYNPLALNFNHANGEWGSYVGTTRGVEAHYTTTQTEGSPMMTQVWDEPRGKFLVQIETEITNSGSHAVRIDGVGEPSFGYRTRYFHVSFYRNDPFPYEAGAKFHPFTLAGHSQKMVTVSYLQYCTTRAPVTEDGHALPSGPTALPVTFSFLGFTHTDEVPVMTFSFVAPLSC